MSDTNPFYKLAPFIQEFIYKNKWETMREIQVEACRVIFETNHHLLIASGTASGKTEAAFFPIITDLYNNPVHSIHTLYISPLKALINDQFLRLNDLLEEAYIPVWQWHGDVSQSHKNKLLKKPSGILQITPESLEAILINKNSEITSLFRELKFIVIDEIHSFMGTERGMQVLCLISRISTLCKIEPRRIGLSATMGDYLYASEWLQSGTSTNVEICNPSSGKRSISIAIEHFKNYKGDDAEEFNDEHYKFIYDNTMNKKCIVFTNSRGEAESTTYHLKEFAKNNGTMDNYYVHHGSISSVLRHEAETTLKNNDVNAVVAATLTLELGIDIGKLDRVLQVGTPFSCASFVQRLGRSGRISGKSEMVFVDVENNKNKETPDFLPWSLLQTIAIIELYISERWIENPSDIHYPFSVFYHRIISTLMSSGELTPQALAKQVLTLPPFKNITFDDLREILNYLISIEHIQKVENGCLIVGLEAEKIANNYHFYAVFNDDVEYKVMNNSREIGSIHNIPPVDTTILLSGRSWLVNDADLERKIIFVTPTKSKAKISWNGGIGNIDDRILKKIKEVLSSADEYSYLLPNALIRLKEAREFTQKTKLLNNNIVSLGNNTFFLLPWVGSRKMETLYRLFSIALKDKLKIKTVGCNSCYYMVITSFLDKNSFMGSLEKILDAPFHSFNLIREGEDLIINKYDKYIPVNLREKAYISNSLFMSMKLSDIMKLSNDL